LCKRGEVILYCDRVYNFFQYVHLYIISQLSELTMYTSSFEIKQ